MALKSPDLFFVVGTGSCSRNLQTGLVDGANDSHLSAALF